MFKHGASFFTPLFVIRAAENDLPVSRFAFIVSNKVSKHATKRNLLKRRMRAAVASILDTVIPGKDVIIMGTQKLMTGTTAAAYADIERTLIFGLHKSNLIRRHAG